MPPNVAPLPHPPGTPARCRPPGTPAAADRPAHQPLPGRPRGTVPSCPAPGCTPVTPAAPKPWRPGIRHPPGDTHARCRCASAVWCVAPPEDRGRSGLRGRSSASQTPRSSPKPESSPKSQVQRTGERIMYWWCEPPIRHPGAPRLADAEPGDSAGRRSRVSGHAGVAGRVLDGGGGQVAGGAGDLGRDFVARRGTRLARCRPATRRPATRRPATRRPATRHPARCRRAPRPGLPPRRVSTRRRRVP